MKKLLGKFTALDHKIVHWMNESYDENIAWLFDSISVNPAIVYLIAFGINLTYFDNKYFVVLLLYIFAGVIVVIMKQIIGRHRPIPRHGNLMKKIFDFENDSYSFPSAHTFGMFQLIPLMFSMFSWLGIVFIFYAAFVAFSRLYMKFHYFSDILVGALLGIFWGAFILIALGFTIL